MTEHLLVEVANTRIYFGKFKGSLLLNVPEEYFLWLKNNGGFPKGKLGEQMALMLEIKQNGLTHLLRPLVKK